MPLITKEKNAQVGKIFAGVDTLAKVKVKSKKVNVRRKIFYLLVLPFTLEQSNY
jgi:hypothetical protein